MPAVRHECAFGHMRAANEWRAMRFILQRRRDWRNRWHGERSRIRIEASASGKKRPYDDYRTQATALSMSTISTAVVEITEAVEAILELLRAEHLIAGQIGPGGPAAPAEMAADVRTPLRAAKTATESVVGFGLNLGDARIEFAACALTFDLAAPVILAKAEAEATVVETKRLGAYDLCRAHDERGS